MSGAREAMVVGAAAFLVLANPLGVQGQEEPTLSLDEPPSHEREPDPLRIVYLRSGGYVRGTVVATTRDALTVRRIDGETLRIARSDIARIALMAEDHEERESRGLPTVRVRFVAEEPGVALDLSLGDHQRFVVAAASQDISLGSEGNASQIVVEVQPELASDRERVCIAPCTFDIVPGSYHFALAIGEQLSHPADALELREATELRGIFESRQTARTVGYILIAAAALSVAATLAAMFLRPDLAAPIFAAGAGFFLAAGTTSLILMLQEDQARFEMRP